MARISENPLPLPERGLVRVQPGKTESLPGPAGRANRPGRIDRRDQDGGFAGTVKKMIMEVDAMQKDSDETIKQFATGEVTDIHEVTIAAEQSRLAFSLLLQVRNKLLEAYHEVMRTQV